MQRKYVLLTVSVHAHWRNMDSCMFHNTNASKNWRPWWKTRTSGEKLWHVYVEIGKNYQWVTAQFRVWNSVDGMATRCGLVRVQTPVRAKYFIFCTPVRTDPGAHSASWAMDTDGSFPALKRLVRGVQNARPTYRQQYLYCPSVPKFGVKGRRLPSLYKVAKHYYI